MRLLWTEIKYVKSVARVLDRIWVNKGGLDLSKKVLWDSVGQRAAVLQAVKVGGQKKILPISPARAIRVRTGAIGRILCWPPTLTACKTAALWPTETHSASLERSKPLLLTKSLSKSLTVILTYLIFSKAYQKRGMATWPMAMDVLPGHDLHYVTRKHQKNIYSIQSHNMWGLHMDGRYLHYRHSFWALKYFLDLQIIVHNHHWALPNILRNNYDCWWFQSIAESGCA